MADKQIHELLTLGRDPTTTDVLAIDTGATTMKVEFGTLNDTIVAAANIGIVAAPYSTSTSYAVGDYCIRDGALYRCITAIPTGEAWTSGHWTAVTLGADVAGMSRDVSGLQTTVSGIEGDISDLESAIASKTITVSGTTLVVNV